MHHELRGVPLVRQNIDMRPIEYKVDRSNGEKHSAKRVKKYLKRLRWYEVVWNTLCIWLLITFQKISIANIFLLAFQFFPEVLWQLNAFVSFFLFSLEKKKKRHSSCFWVFLYCRANTRVLEKTQSDSRIKEKKCGWAFILRRWCLKHWEWTVKKCPSGLRLKKNIALVRKIRSLSRWMPVVLQSSRKNWIVRYFSLSRKKAVHSARLFFFSLCNFVTELFY